jgi:hypothetical protein
MHLLFAQENSLIEHFEFAASEGCLGCDCFAVAT